MHHEAPAIDPLATPRQTVARRHSAGRGRREIRVEQVVTSRGASGAALRRFDSEHAAEGAHAPAPFFCPRNASARLHRDRYVSRRAQMNRDEQRKSGEDVMRGDAPSATTCRARVATVRRYPWSVAPELSSDSAVDSRMKFFHAHCERVTSRRVSVRSDSQGGFAVTSARGRHIF